MIRYYFGSKEGLYEEMIRETLQTLLEHAGLLLDEVVGLRSPGAILVAQTRRP